MRRLFYARSELTCGYITKNVQEGGVVRSTESVSQTLNGIPQVCMATEKKAVFTSCNCMYVMTGIQV